MVNWIDSEDGKSAERRLGDFTLKVSLDTLSVMVTLESEFGGAVAAVRGWGFNKSPSLIMAKREARYALAAWMREALNKLDEQEDTNNG